MSTELIKVLYSLLVLATTITASMLVDSYRRLSKALRLVAYLVIPSLFVALEHKYLFDFQVILILVGGLAAYAISIHAEGYYRLLYGIARHFQVVIDTTLALLVLVFSSTYFLELMIYWLALDIVLALAALSLEHGIENLPIVIQYVIMCVVPSDISLLTAFSAVVLELGLSQAIALPLYVIPKQINLGPVLSAIIVFGFATKIGQFPLHTWLPRVHGEAPTHTSAILSGLVIKLGLLGLLIASKIFVIDAIAYYMLLAQGIVSTLYGSLGAVMQSHIKRILAYSSVGYGGILVSLLALYSIYHASYLYTAMLLVLVFHILAKALGFLNAAAVFYAANTYDVYSLGYLYYVSKPLSFNAFTVFLSLSGIPPSIGFLVKVFIILASILLLEKSIAAIVLLIAIITSAVFSIAYSAKLISAYTSKIPRTGARYVVVPSEILVSELLVSLAIVASPLVAIVYGLLSGSLLYDLAVPVLVVYIVLLVAYVLALRREVLKKEPLREDVKYWLSGVEL